MFLKRLTVPLLPLEVLEVLEVLVYVFRIDH